MQNWQSLSLLDKATSDRDSSFQDANMRMQIGT